MQDIEMFREVPGYRAILKAVIKQQIQGLINQLARHTGEESVLMTASVEEGTLTHLGSDHGKVFMDSREELKAQFLGFCLKRNHIKSSAHHNDQFMRKKGPIPARNRLINNKSFSSGVRHQPYPSVVKSEPVDSSGELKPVNYSKEKYQNNQPKNHSFDSMKPINLSVHPSNEYGVKVKFEKVTEASIGKNVESSSSSQNGEASSVVSHTESAHGSPACVSQSVGLVQNKETSLSKESTPEPKEHVTKREMPELVNEKEVNQNNEELANRNVELQHVMETDPGDERPSFLTNSPAQTSPGAAEPAELPRTEELPSLGTPDEPTLGAYQYTLATSHRKSRKSQEPRKKASYSSPVLVEADVSPSMANSKSINIDMKTPKSQHVDTDIKTPPHDLMECEMNGQDSDAERSALQRKQELESYLCLDHNARPYPCNLCPKRFKERHHLIYHIRTHSGQRPYKCLTCGKAFTQSSSLNTHKKTHYKDISCMECGLVFKKQLEFINHACQSLQGSLILS